MTELTADMNADIRTNKTADIEPHMTTDQRRDPAAAVMGR